MHLSSQFCLWKSSWAIINPVEERSVRRVIAATVLMGFINFKSLIPVRIAPQSQSIPM